MLLFANNHVKNCLGLLSRTCNFARLKAACANVFLGSTTILKNSNTLDIWFKFTVNSAV